MNPVADERRLTALVAEQPEALDLWAELGDVRFALGHYAGALECYENVLDEDPDDLDCRIGLARCLSRRPELARRVARHIEQTVNHERVDPDLLGPAVCVLNGEQPRFQVAAERAAAEVDALTPIRDEAVREFYEANPYPQWRRISRGTPRPLADHPHPRLLVAGCGTGRELLNAAYNWQPSSVTAFDLSRTSLAYAQAKAQELGIEVEFHQADLLALDDWDRQFDVIVCTGVLHHLEEPLRGWRTLVRLLRPGGAMFVGLYSRTAREGIRVAQEQVRGMDLPQARAHILGLPQGHPARDVTLLQDFYNAAGCHDLLFHVREHQFTVPEIENALDELGLRFVDFEVPGDVRQRYRTLFGARSTLPHWEAFERLYPKTFLGMYQFWCERPVQS